MTGTTDYAIRGTAYQGLVRAFSCVTTGMVNEMQKRHQTWPVASAALGRTVSAGAMMGMMLKNDSDKMTIQIQGDGPLGADPGRCGGWGEGSGLRAKSRSGSAQQCPGKVERGRCVGQGTLNVVKDLGLREPYRGSVNLVSGELGDDFTYYLTASEQIPSSVGVGVLVAPDGGNPPFRRFYHPADARRRRAVDRRLGTTDPALAFRHATDGKRRPSRGSSPPNPGGQL